LWRLKNSGEGEELQSVRNEHSVWASLQRTLPARITLLHYLGGVAIVFFALQFLTGLLLVAYYRPSVEDAHASIRILSDEVRFGWLVRFLHHWGTHFLIVLVSLHAIRVYFSRAYRPPRGFNWVLGVSLLVLTLALAFTGTLLPWDQYAYWYIDSARATIARVPVLGNFMLGLMWGGWELGGEVLLRFYALHVGVLPCFALVALFLHFWVIWNVGISEPAGAADDKPREPVPLFPDFLVNLLIVTLLLGGLLLTAAVLYPPALGLPANPLEPLPEVHPPWYLLPIREALTDLPGWLSTLAVVVFFALIFLVPALDRRPVLRTWQKLVHWGLGAAIIAGWVTLGIWGSLR
jgi:quinol-cytochrome oxidoreductase complex cytochrome b subunit